MRNRFSNVIPLLLKASNEEDDINILIGSNGCGKSSLLREIQMLLSVNDGVRVLAISNTIYHKFTKRGLVLSPSSFNGSIKEIMLAALKSCIANEYSDLSQFARPLIYTGFKPSIGFSLKGIDEDFREKIIHSDMSNLDREEFMYFLNRVDENKFLNKTIWIDFNGNPHKDIEVLANIHILIQEKLLRRLGVIKGVNLFLKKGETIIPINKASSGELSIMSTLIFISTHMTRNTTILIDEPENSLHPEWQVEYVKNITDLFWLYQPKIIIGTHSPLIIDGAKSHNSKVKVFKGDDDSFKFRKDQGSRNVEEIYENYFNVITPQNRYLAEQIIENLNQLASKDLNYSRFVDNIEQFINQSYEDTQKKALQGVLEIAKRIRE